MNLTINASFPYHYVFTTGEKLYIHEDILVLFDEEDPIRNYIGLIPTALNEYLASIWGYKATNGRYRYNPVYAEEDSSQLLVRTLDFFESIGIQFY